MRFVESLVFSLLFVRRNKKTHLRVRKFITEIYQHDLPICLLPCLLLTHFVFLALIIGLSLRLPPSVFYSVSFSQRLSIGLRSFDLNALDSFIENAENAECAGGKLTQRLTRMLSALDTFVVHVRHAKIVHLTREPRSLRALGIRSGVWVAFKPL